MVNLLEPENAADSLPVQGEQSAPGFVTLTAAAHPFRVSRDIVMVREGASLADMLHTAQPDPVFARHANIFIDGNRINRRYWPRVYPKAGTHVEIKVLPSGGGGGGGGKNLLRTVAMLAVLAASFAAPALLGLAAGSFGASLVTAGTGLIGMLLVSVLIPAKQPKLGRDDSSRVFSIEGTRNRARPFQSVPQILGKHRIKPDYGARPFTEIIGDDQYLHLIFCWGVGPLDIDTSSLRIGETPITDFDGVEIEHREGTSGDAALTLYPDTVTEDALSIFLGAHSESGSTGAHTRTAAPDGDEISIDILLPNGLVNINQSSGGQSALSVMVRVEYREVGSGTWLTPTFTAKTFPDNWVNGNQITFTHKTQSTIRHGMRWSVGSRGQYEVRVERITDTTGATDRIDHTYWTALRTFTNEAPIQSQVPVALTALRIRATEQLNGVVDEFNGIVTTKGKDWNGSSWVDDQLIQNPASLFRHVLQGKANVVPLPDSRLDLVNLQDWHDFCETNGFKCNQVRDFEGSVWDAMADVAGAGRASPAEPDGKWGVVIDRKQAVPVSHVTPRNSSDFNAEKAFLDLPHAFRIPFPNEDEDYRLDERRVYRPGFDAQTATRFEQLEIPGVTDPDQIWTFGRYRMAQGVHQPERWTFRQDMEFLTYGRGDRIVVTHDVLLIGLHSGRVKSVTVDGSNNVTALEVDEQVSMESGKSYGIAIRTVNDTHITRQVVTDAGDQTALTLSAAIAAVGGQPAVAKNDLFGFGLLGSETDDAMVISVKPDSDFRALVTVVPYREAIYDSDTETIPPFNTNLTPLPEIPPPNITNVVSDESVLAFGPGQSLVTRVSIAFTPLGSITDQFSGAYIEVQARPSETGEPYGAAEIDEQSQGRVILSGVRDGETWDFRLRWRAEQRLPGPWVEVFNHTVIGKSTPPSGLSGMTISAFGNGALIRWDRPSELDVRFGGEVRFRHSPLFTGATWAGSSSIGEMARARDLQATLPLKPGTYLAHVFDSGGNRSETVATVTTKQASVLTYANADSLDEDPSFGGTHNGTIADSGTLKMVGAGQFDDIADFDAVEDLDSLGGVVASGTYEFQFGFDLTTVKKVRLTTRLSVVIANVLDLIDDRFDPIDEWEDVDGSDQASGDIRVEVRHTDDEPSASPTWSAWERLDSAEYDARGFEFRAILTSNDPAYNVHVTDLGIDAEEVT